MLLVDRRIVLVDTDSAVQLDGPAISSGFTPTYCPEIKTNQRVTPSEVFDLRCLGHSLYRLATGGQPEPPPYTNYSLPKHIPLREIYSSAFSSSTSAEFLLHLFVKYFPSVSRRCEQQQEQPPTRLQARQHEEGVCGCWFRPLTLKEAQPLRELCAQVVVRICPPTLLPELAPSIVQCLSGVDILRFLHSFLRIQYFKRQH